jgi:hypothetical protein
MLNAILYESTHCPHVAGSRDCFSIQRTSPLSSSSKTSIAIRPRRRFGPDFAAPSVWSRTIF